MSRTSRQQRRIEVLEAEYRASLIVALRDCASGRWGLFGHNEHVGPIVRRPAVVDGLFAMAEVINRVRAQVGEGPFELHDRFLAARGPQDPNAVGEPKVAQAWLRDLTAESEA